MPGAANTAAGFLDLDWIWVQLTGGNAVPFLSWTATAFLVSCSLGAVFRSFLTNRRIRSELGLKSGFERVNTVDRLIEKADELSGLESEVESLRSELASRPTSQQLEECERRVSKLEGENNALRARLEKRSPQEQVRRPSGALATNLAAIEAFSPDMAAAAIETFDSNGSIPFGPFESTVRESINRHDGVFSVDTYWFMGSPTGKENGKYHLTREWHDFMDDVDVLGAMRTRAEHSSIRMEEVAKKVVHEEITPLADEDIDAIWNGASTENEAKGSLARTDGDGEVDSHMDNFSRTFSFLNNRERYCIARLVEVEDANKGLSVSSNHVIRPAFESLVKMGMVVRTGSREIGGKPVVSYTISPEWREWLRSHTELFSGVTEADAGLGDYTITRNQL